MSQERINALKAKRVAEFMQWHASLSPAEKNAFNAAFGRNPNIR